MFPVSLSVVWSFRISFSFLSTGGRQGGVQCTQDQALLHPSSKQEGTRERDEPGSWEVCVFQVAGIISAGIVMVAIVALGKLLEPLQKV